jgi:hypothetical protein
MSKLLLPLTVFIAALSLTSCGWGKDKKPKSSAHLYEGDSPSITFTKERETAGGPVSSPR